MSEIRELFVDDLVEVTGGGRPLPDLDEYTHTTHACCEEGPFGCCGTLDPIRELIGP